MEKYFDWNERRRRDSNPRTGVKTDKLISSQPRYGLFGTSPFARYYYNTYFLIVQVKKYC